MNKPLIAAEASPSASPAQPNPAVKPSPAASSSPSPQAPARRAKPQPLDAVFPLTEYLGPTIGVPRDTTQYPFMKLLGLDGDKKLGGFRVYGWLNPGGTISTSKNSNYPQTYTCPANMLVLDQAVLRFEKQVDTAQTDHMDWGFEISNMYGIDYRWTTAKGWFSNQLLSHNQWNGYDPVEAYFQVYIPKVCQGMVLTGGRFISPADIEAQLAPQNLLYTHSVFFDYDAYTQTGMKAEIKIDDNWSILLAAHGGNDTAAWNKAAHLSGEGFARWVSDNNKDSLWFGIDSINGGQFTDFKDNFSQVNVNWTHKFNDWINNQWEFYYLWENNALLGGTVNFGPIKPRMGPFGGGPGPLLPGVSTATGYVNYLNFKVDDRSYLSWRTDIMADPRGWRSGFPNCYFETTLGYVRHLTDTTTIRPEIRWETGFNNPAYDNGTKRSQASFDIDLIQYF